jgi:hypothetical protein
MMIMFLVTTATVAASVDYSCLHANAWLVNDRGHSNAIFQSSTDISSLSFISASSTVNVAYTNIPDYDRNFTVSDIATLNARPKRTTDFSTSTTTAKAGNHYVFGANIGYASSHSCPLDFWPPGPGCPLVKSASSGKRHSQRIHHSSVEAVQLQRTAFSNDYCIIDAFDIPSWMHPIRLCVHSIHADAEERGDIWWMLQ